MRELGADAFAPHEAAGRRAREAGVARLFALGALAAKAAAAIGEGGDVFASHHELAAALRNALAGAAAAAPTGDTAVPTVLVKGSRGSAMDRVVRALLEGVENDAA